MSLRIDRSWSPFPRHGRRSATRLACAVLVTLALVWGHSATQAERTPRFTRDALLHARTLRGRARRATGSARSELVERACEQLERAWAGEFPPRDVGEATLSTAALCAASGNFDTARGWLQRMLDVRTRVRFDVELTARARLELAHLWRRSEHFEHARTTYAELSRDVRVGPRDRERARLGIASVDALQGLFHNAERTWIELIASARTPSVRVDAWLALARNEHGAERSDRVRAWHEQLLVNFEHDAARGDERAERARLRLQRHR